MLLPSQRFLHLLSFKVHKQSANRWKGEKNLILTKSSSEHNLPTENVELKNIATWGIPSVHRSLLHNSLLFFFVQNSRINHRNWWYLGRTCGETKHEIFDEIFCRWGQEYANALEGWHMRKGVAHQLGRVAQQWGHWGWQKGHCDPCLDHVCMGQQLVRNWTKVVRLNHCLLFSRYFTMGTQCFLAFDTCHSQHYLFFWIYSFCGATLHSVNHLWCTSGHHLNLHKIFPKLTSFQVDNSNHFQETTQENGTAGCFQGRFGASGDTSITPKSKVQIIESGSIFGCPVTFCEGPDNMSWDTWFCENSVLSCYVFACLTLVLKLNCLWYCSVSVDRNFGHWNQLPTMSPVSTTGLFCPVLSFVNVLHSCESDLRFPWW